VHAVPAAQRSISILGVADGVGGAAGGEYASALTVNHVGSVLAGAAFDLHLRGVDDEQAVEVLKEQLEAALIDSNQLVLDHAEADEALTGMATTAVFAVVLSQRLLIGWVGDSRAYLFTHGRLLPMTYDHSVVAELLDSGVITHEQAKNHPRAHVITRYVGQRQEFSPEIATHRVSEDFTLLLCTDGLTDVVSNAKLQHYLAQVDAGAIRFEDLPRTLIEHALAAGTTDNVSVVCCRSRAVQPQLAVAQRTATGDYVSVLAENLTQLHMEDSQ